MSKIDNQESISLEDIFLLASGLDKDGAYAAACSISINRMINDNDVIQVKNVYINEPVYFYCRGGGLVAVIDFDQKNHANYYNAANLCMGWLESGEDTLVFNIIPMVFGGSLVLALTGLIYCDFYTRNNRKRRLILCFDNASTSVIATDDISAEDIKKTVDYEIKKEEESMENEIAALEEEGRQIQEEEDALQYLYDYNTLTFTQEEDESRDSGLRVAREENGLKAETEDFE